MSEHVSAAELNRFVDGELSVEQAAAVNAHLAECPACTSVALSQMMLKSATAKAGQRYSMPDALRERVLQRSAQTASAEAARKPVASASRGGWKVGGLGWATAAAAVVLAVGGLVVQRIEWRSSVAQTESAALETEALDQHVAELASGLEPQVVSTDRHTVKPWFQGKIPFSFNLPEGLAADTTLDGANLTYLHDQPVAQLLYRIGKHRVSVFLRVSSGTGKELTAERSGFHVRGFRKGTLEGVAVSDVEAAQLDGLVAALEAAQTR